MNTGLTVTIVIILFIIGSIMGLKPNAKETRLDNLRNLARKLGLNPKLVPCPDWISPTDDPLNKGKGMIAQYGIILDTTTMRPCDYQIIDGTWRPYTANYPANFALDNQPTYLPEGLPKSIAPFVKALSAKANFICIYWQENIALGDKSALETTEKDLIDLKSYLHKSAERIQQNSTKG